ncbi:hypothetical protein VFPPC_13986 [Pochonia chlamydosporia 170]|uniref:Uncharacterized protein n=1 Tax=Pochonia chlamydosporia 170 TaxID=1380566 RepID=A0A179FHE2_METCM|nr:hypothetical protein VFPPC_13986 [Pochonia chlamydosporia 170]OAQ65035.1 hypothetical protein VFPPC_13986 [Pochonia chlamydosporia 170]
MPEDEEVVPPSKVWVLIADDNARGAEEWAIAISDLNGIPWVWWKPVTWEGKVTLQQTELRGVPATVVRQEPICLAEELPITQQDMFKWSSAWVKEQRTGQDFVRVMWDETCRHYNVEEEVRLEGLRKMDAASLTYQSRIQR